MNLIEEELVVLYLREPNLRQEIGNSWSNNLLLYLLDALSWYLLYKLITSKN